MTIDEADNLAADALDLMPLTKVAKVALLAREILPYPYDVAKRAIEAHATRSESVSIPDILADIRRAAPRPPAVAMSEAEASARRNIPPPDPSVQAAQDWCAALTDDEFAERKRVLLVCSPALRVSLGNKPRTSIPLQCALFGERRRMEVPA